MFTQSECTGAGSLSPKEMARSSVVTGFPPINEAENVRQFPVRRYQNRNLRDLDFPDHTEDTEQNGTHMPSLLPFFTQTTKYCTTAVLEESVIDNESLKQTPLLKSFDPRFVEELFKVEGCTRAIVHLPDTEISRQGDSADSLVVIVHGQVDVFVDGVKQRRLTDGDYFGEREFMGVCAERASTAISVTFCDARVMYRSCLTRTLDRCPVMKTDYPYMLSVWRQKSERDALRFMKVFTERCMECMDVASTGPESPDSPKSSSSTSPKALSASALSSSASRGKGRMPKIGQALAKVGK